MRTHLERLPFYSLPPAGNKIPLKAIIRALRKGKNPSAGPSDPVKELLPAKYLFYLSSGRAALWLLLKALSSIRPDRKEVVVPAYTCPAVASAVLKAGLKVILCDIDLDDFGFSKEELEKKVGGKTLAVIVVHLFGYPANIQFSKECCGKDGVCLIEDAAQAFGNSLLDSPESKLGLLTDAGFFSFGRGKPVSVLHGGILATNSEEISRHASAFMNTLNHRGFQNLKYGMLLSSYSIFSSPYLYWIPQGMPFLHLGETIFEPDFSISAGVNLAAALVNEISLGIESEKAVRKENSQWYSENLPSISGIQGPKNPDFPYLRYPFFVQNPNFRDRILEELTSQGTGAALFYPLPLNELPGLKEVLNDNSIYPNAKEMSESLITLPVHSGVRPAIRSKILKIIRKNVC